LTIACKHFGNLSKAYSPKFVASDTSLSTPKSISKVPESEHATQTNRVADGQSLFENSTKVPPTKHDNHYLSLAMWIYGDLRSGAEL